MVFENEQKYQARLCESKEEKLMLLCPQSEWNMNNSLEIKDLFVF